MQDFRDNEKKTIKHYRQLAILDFISAIFVMGYPCLSPHILFYMHGPAFCFVFVLRKYHNLKKIKNSRYINGHFKIVRSQTLIRSLADIAVHISQIKRRSAGNFFLKCAKEYFFVGGSSN